ncbi:protein CURVATURE THYLAKOID 1B, chloroplastic-like [Prosopis cineraria]|uniref:protein CURVATURE THYLAKOID 1B, chloroplastic-like n=1 Tax=Prosopis cineraria TaxID=364024 RepID=UPI00240FBE63|nr:protein CURVATURE THYLAKOID 1B, chloroplastic-like [Prosopis cineraria]
MASTSSPSLALSSSSITIVDLKTPRRSAPSSPQCVSLPAPPSPPSSLPSHQNRSWKPTAYRRKLARNVMAMATGEASDVATTEPPEFLKTVQETWEKIEDKYAVSTLGVAVVVVLWGSTGVISAIDRLPLIPGVLEIAGIGYTGWFAYKNLIYKPDREALLQKIKETYYEIIGSSS